MNRQSDLISIDYRIITELVEHESSVLDLGCGKGDLLSLLISKKNVKAQGVEIDDKAIFECVEKGLSVFHGNIDSGLADYGDKSFDYVILNQSLQEVIHVESVLNDALRVGREVIVGFPNFAHYNARMQIFFKGIAPVTSSLPNKWYDTPNLHFLSIRDFIEYCYQRNITIEKAVYFGRYKVYLFPNLFAAKGIFLISKK
jgi:methionine biosynthesis protein MetW